MIEPNCNLCGIPWTDHGYRCGERCSEMMLWSTEPTSLPAPSAETPAMLAPSDLRTLTAEIRDLCRYSPEWQHRLTKRIADNLYRYAMEALVLRPDGTEVCAVLKRLSGNLSAGRDLIITSPSVLGGYLAAAALELDAVAERMERADSEHRVKQEQPA